MFWILLYFLFLVHLIRILLINWYIINWYSYKLKVKVIIAKMSVSPDTL